MMCKANKAFLFLIVGLLVLLSVIVCFSFLSRDNYVFAEDNPPDIEAPSAPNNLFPTGKTVSTVDLVWDASSDNTGVVGYNVFNGDVLAGESAQTSYSVTGLSPCNEYSFTVKALDAAGNVSECSNTVTVKTPPDKPVNVTATPSLTTVILEWDAVDNAEGYDVEVDGLTLIQVTTAAFIHDNPVPDTLHSYRVRVRAAEDSSEWSSPVSAATLLETPANLSAAALDTCMTITWDTVAGAASYEIEVDGVLADTGTATLYKHTSLSPGSQHTYRVRAKGRVSTSNWTGLLNAVTKTGTPVSGTINQNAIWDLNGSPYIVQGNLTVASGVQLQIMPGVVIKVKPGVSVILNGKIEAQGTVDSGIVFTSTKDADYGGTGVSTSSDYWAAMHIKSSGDLSAAHIIVRYGGNYSYSGNYRCIINEGKIGISNSLIGNAYRNAVFIAASNDVSLENSRIENNGAGGITVNSYGTGNLKIQNNTIMNNAGYPIYINLSNLSSSIFSGISGNTCALNTYNGLEYDSPVIEGTIKANLTISAATPSHITKNVSVPQGLTLTIEPGVVLKSDHATNKLTVHGKVIATGTQSNPVVLTTIRDTEYGGTGVFANTDYWNGILISSTGEFFGDGVTVRYGGNWTREKTFDVQGKLLLKNSNIQNPYSKAFLITSNYNVTIENTLIRDCGSTGIYIDTTGAGNIAVTGSILENCRFDGIYVNQFGIGALDISGNNIRNNYRYGLGVSLAGLNSSIFTGIRDNLLSGNANEMNSFDNIVIEGSPKVNLLLAGGKYMIAGGNVTIPSTVTVTMEPGVTVQSYSTSTEIVVNGKLHTLGTEQKPIIFTTYTDPVSTGGSVSKAWGGIRVTSTGEFSGDHVKVKFGCNIYGYSCIAVFGKLSLTNSEIYEANSKGIYFDTAIQPTVRFNSFINNPYAVYNNRASEIIIDAAYNYWNSLYGPGYSQNRVNSGVSYIPWLGSELKYQIHYGEKGVHAPTGNYSKTFNDMLMPSPGFEIAISRTYNAKDERTAGPLGKGWTFGFEGSIKDYAANVPVKVVRLPNGSVQSFTANADGSLTANDSRSKLDKQPDGTFVLTTKDQYRYGFSAYGYLAWMKDRHGNTVNIDVDANGKVQGITDQAQRRIGITYENGLIVTINDPCGRQVVYEYENNRLVRAIDRMGNSTRYSYDSEGFLNEIRNHQSQLIESIVYDHAAGENQHKVYQITDTYGNTHTYSYDNSNRKTTITDTNGRETVQWYDSSGYITNTRDPEGKLTTMEYYLDTNGFNNFGEEKSVTDRNGNKTQYERDGAGNITKITNPDASYRLQGYDDRNNLVSERDEEGIYTYYVYDAEKKNLVKKVQPFNGTDMYTVGCDESKFAFTTFVYYSEEECLSLGYKARGLLKTEIDPEGNQTTYTYDADGNLETVKDPETNKVTSYEYDIIGWKTAEISPKGYRTDYAHDRNGNLVKSILHGGETTRIIYDTAGRKVKEVAPNLYDSQVDDLVHHLYNGDHGTRYEYFANGKVKSVTDAENNITSYTYDLYGNVETETKPNDAVYRYEYDVMNRLIKVFFKENENSTEILLEEYVYEVLVNKNTRKTQIRYLNDVETAALVAVYDYAGREISRLNADGTTTASGYYANGNLKTVTDARGNTTYYLYDGHKRLSEQWTPFEKAGNTTKYAYKKITYDKAGRQKQVLLGKESVSLYALPATFAVTEYDYYKNGKVKSIIDSEGRKTEYQYDDDGILSREDVYTDAVNKNSVEFSNNHMGKPDYKMVHVKVGDVDGNSFNDTADMILTTGYTYDKNGNLLTITTPNEVTTTYEYDNLNRQASISQPGQDELGNPVTIKTTTQFDWEGNPLIVADAKNQVTTYTYNQRGLLTFITDAKLGVTAFYYDRAGRKIAEVTPEYYDPAKVLEEMCRREYAYDKMDRVKTVTDIYLDPVTSQWVTVTAKAYKYDNNGNILKELDALGYDAGTGITVEDKVTTGYGTEYVYNLANKVVTVLDAVSKQRSLAYTVKYEYDTLARKVRETDAEGVITCYYYDDAGNVTSVAVKKTTNDPEQVIRVNTYDLVGNLIAETAGNGNTVTFEYNTWNKVRAAVYPGDTSIAPNTIIYQYDVMGNLKKQRNSLGTLDLYTYDIQGRQLFHKQQKEDGTQTITTAIRYDKNGNKQFETDGNGKAKEYTYDELNRLKTASITVSGTVHITAYDYDKNGNLKTETDWRNNVYTKIYDPLNRLIEKKDPYGKSVQKLVYNKNNAQVKSYDALDNLTQYEYDRNNRLVRTIDPENHETSQTYDNVGNIKTKKDGKNNTTTYEYDEFHRLKSVVNAKNEATSYTYDLNGNMLTQTDGKANTTVFEYNTANKEMRRVDPGGRTGTPGNYMYDPTKTESYTYYDDGSLHTKVDRNGNTTTYTYDCHGRLIEEVVGEILISYTYDGNGNQLTLTDSTGTTVRTYDELGRVLTKSVPDIGTSTYTYDIIMGVDEGCVKEKSVDPKGNIAVKLYDKGGRLWKVTADGNTTTYSYYDNGSRKSVVYQDGAREDYVYYKDNLLWTLTNKKADGSIIDTYTYEYDAAHNQTRKVDGRGTTIYSYDALNRLETVTEPNGRVTGYTYDKAGNRETETITEGTVTTTNTYSYNEQNRLTGIVKKVDGVLTETTAYGYDNNGNQLTVMTNGQSVATNSYDKKNQLLQSVSGSNIVINTYNGEGFRTARSVNGVITRYLYEYDKVVLELDIAGNQTARNVYGNNLLMRSKDGQTLFYMYNGHGDVTALMGTDGTVKGSYYYDAFGNILEHTGVDSSITYAGYQWDSETGLYYLNARYYDSKIARFISEDTYRGQANDPLSLNLYTYCHNEPVLCFLRGKNENAVNSNKSV